MDDIFSLIFFMWVIFTLFEGIANKKKNLPPPTLEQQQESESNTFEIPRLANDPNEMQNPLPTSEVVEVEKVNDVEQIFRQRQEFMRRQITSSKLSNTVPKEFDNQPKNDVNFTPADVVNAFLFSEIFGKPKSLRKH